MPTEEELRAAPLLDDWYLYPARPGALVVVATVSGHPRLPDGPVTTSRVIAHDEKAGWCQTLNRLYRLGRPYAPKPVRVPDGESGRPSRPIQLGEPLPGSFDLTIVPGVDIPAYVDDDLPMP
ncbi:DUF6634 family protein [Microvirga sp. 0TCS3.31]